MKIEIKTDDVAKYKPIDQFKVGDIVVNKIYDIPECNPYLVIRTFINHNPTNICVDMSESLTIERCDYKTNLFRKIGRMEINVLIKDIES